MGSERLEGRFVRQEGVKPSSTCLQLLDYTDQFIYFDSSFLLQMLEGFLSVLVLAGYLQLLLPVILLSDNFTEITSHT